MHRTTTYHTPPDPALGHRVQVPTTKPGITPFWCDGPRIPPPSPPLTRQATDKCSILLPMAATTISTWQLPNSLALQGTWSVWKSKWRGDPKLTHLSDFDTFEGFLQSVGSTPSSSLTDKHYLHIFRQGIRPMWEDPQNASGGHFKLMATTPEASTALWQALLLNMLFDQLPGAAKCNGASIVVHNIGNNIVKLWLGTAHTDAVGAVKAFLRRTLRPEDYVAEKITFVPHKLVIRGSSKKPPQQLTDAPGPAKRPARPPPAAARCAEEASDGGSIASSFGPASEDERHSPMHARAKPKAPPPAPPATPPALGGRAGSGSLQSSTKAPYFTDVRDAYLVGSLPPPPPVGEAPGPAAAAAAPLEEAKRDSWRLPHTLSHVHTAYADQCWGLYPTLSWQGALPRAYTQ